MNVRLLLIVLNIVGFLALAAYAIWAVLSPRRARAEGERTPANRTEFLPDEDLEGRRLERVLGWALLFGGVLAVTLPLYWLREPTRQEHMTTHFDQSSVERGQTRYAGPESEGYDSVLSLQCANCHGDDGSGGSSNRIIDPDGAEGPLPPQQFTWREPALNTVLLRFSPEEVASIITYGRPGTPMAAFGVAGGGAQNEQTINDIVAYLETIQLSPEAARAQADEELRLTRTAAEDQLEAAEEALVTANTALDDALTEARDVLGLAGADETELLSRCEELEQQIEDDPSTVTREERAACRDVVRAVAARDSAERNVEWSETWLEARDDVSDGQLLFESHCARCHTEGWSTFDPADPDSLILLGPPGGGGGQGGGIGFNLRDGATVRRFGPGTAGAANQEQFVSSGSNANEEYGNLGIGSGRMPGFGQMLTQEQIAAIVEYEREGLDETVFPEEGDGD